MKLCRLAVIATLGAMLAAPVSAQSPINSALGAQWRNADGQLRWPPNDGCTNTEVAETLPPGAKIDRYGSENGSYFAQPGTPYPARALPYDRTQLPYAVYVIRTPLTVEACTTAPWFGEPGGGMQFKAAQSAAQLRAEGVIELP